MSDASLVGQTPPVVESSKTSNTTGTAGTTANQTPTQTVTTSGSVVESSDPSVRPNATMGEKIKGDFQGAAHGVAGSLQAAAGIMTGNKEMEQKGHAKMTEEDQRLGAKKGVMPVGSNLRNEGTGDNVLGFESKK